MQELTEMDTEFGKFYVCDNCGAQADSEDKVVHHTGCKLCESLYWQVIESVDGEIGRKEIEEKTDNAASEVISWIENACGDMAFDYEQCPDIFDDETHRKVEKAKKAGVQDVAGWLADEYYDDEDLLRDMMGDRIHDEAVKIVGADFLTQSIVMIIIAKKIMVKGHSTMKKAMVKIIQARDEFIRDIAKKNRERVDQCVKTILKPIS